MTTTTTLTPAGPVEYWTGLCYQWLTEKTRHSDSTDTYTTYRYHLESFLLSLSVPPDEATTQDVSTWAYANTRTGALPSRSTIMLRIAAVSSWYQWLSARDFVRRNPCVAVERPRKVERSPKMLTGDQIKKLIAAIPETPSGRRDRAIIIYGILTGRRRAELMRLKAGDIDASGVATGLPITYTYKSKGGVERRREMPPPVYQAICEALSTEETFRTPDMLPPDTRLFPIEDRSFYGNLRRHLARAGLPLSGVHILRHTAARLQREAGEELEDVQRFLDHASMATTAIYTRTIEGAKSGAWSKVARRIGVEDKAEEDRDNDDAE